MSQNRISTLGWCTALCVAGASVLTSAQQTQPAAPPPPPNAQTAPDRSYIFDMGEIVVVGSQEGVPGVGGSVLTRDEVWTFDRTSLDKAVNVVPGVSSNFDSLGRRNENDIFVRGFGRWQVPLMLDGVRIYLPADNRLDFARFLTADVAAIQIQKGYASVIDGPGAMGGAINMVTRKPAKALEAEASASLGGRSGKDGWNGYAMAGTRQAKYYLQGSLNYSNVDFWTLSGKYTPPANSLQPAGHRLSSDSSDSRFNVKAGLTPNGTDEYTFNYIKQDGEKGAPLNVYNNPPVPANSYWRWPYWDVQNSSFLSRTQLNKTSYLKSKIYDNTFKNGLEAYDDATYTTQSANGRFSSPYDDHAAGVDLEVGTTKWAKNTLKAATQYRTDTHVEQQTSRPTNPTLATQEPKQTQAQHTWSLALENTFHVRADVDVVAGLSYDKYAITKAEEYNATRGIFEYPKGGSDAVNWQSALIWHYSPSAQVHASVSDRARFPVIFELYSTRFGTATPNPDLGPERATNVELGWKKSAARARVEGSLFYSNVRDLIQTVVLPDTTTQTQNVGNGRFYGLELAIDAPAGRQLNVGGNYTAMSRKITDALQPNLRPNGVPTHKAFLYASWRPIEQLTITPSLGVAGDRWSDVNPVPANGFAYVRTGAYKLFDLSADYAVVKNFNVVLGFKNLGDDNYELAWGYPQPGRTFYFKTRVGL